MLLYQIKSQFKICGCKVTKCKKVNEVWMADVKRFDSRLHHMSLLWLHGCADMTAGRSRVAPKLVLWNFLLLNLAPYFNLPYKKPKITKDQVAHTNANIEPNLQRITRVSRETEMIFYIFSQCWLSCVQIAQVSLLSFLNLLPVCPEKKAKWKLDLGFVFGRCFPPTPFFVHLKFWQAIWEMMVKLHTWT